MTLLSSVLDFLHKVTPGEWLIIGSIWCLIFAVNEAYKRLHHFAGIYKEVALLRMHFDKDPKPEWQGWDEWEKAQEQKRQSLRQLGQ